MAQTGFTPIQLYRTSTAAAVPTAGNLADGELAINLTDEKLYFKNAAGTVKLLAANITAVANGGTGATTAGNARTNLGSTTLGSNLFTITNPGAVTFPRFNADNTVSSLNAADFRTAIGAGTGGGDVTLAGVQTLTNKTLAATTLSGTLSVADNLVNRPVLQDYAIEGSAIGNAGATRTFDFSVANFFSVTINQATTFTFSNPPASGDFGAFVMEITNGAAFVITFPASVDFPGGTAPTLTASGVDQLVFTTRDGGTTYFCFVAGLDIKSP
jgi:hypothetical protein